MIADIRDILTLEDDKDYIVASKTEYKGYIYYYLMDINDNHNILFCYEEDGELVEFDDHDTFINVLPRLLEVSRRILNK